MMTKALPIRFTHRASHLQDLDYLEKLLYIYILWVLGSVFLIQQDVKSPLSGPFLKFSIALTILTSLAPQRWIFLNLFFLLKSYT